MTDNMIRTDARLSFFYPAIIVAKYVTAIVRIRADRALIGDSLKNSNMTSDHGVVPCRALREQLYFWIVAFPYHDKLHVTLLPQNAHESLAKCKM